MTERTRFVAALLEGDETLSALCRQYGISRKCGYKWKQRYDDGGFAALEEVSRAPRRHPNETVEEVVEAILEARRRHPTWGPKKIGPWLHRTSSVDVPCTSTVGAILKRAGLVASRARRPRPPRYVEGLTPGEAPDLVWCVDFKGQFDVGNGRTCWPLTMSDLYSRYLLTCQALTTCRSHQAMPVFLASFHEYGLPQIIRSDNGSPFASRAPGGLSRLGVWWAKLGIRHERTEPSHPEQNGSHERMHRTLKAETTTPREPTITAQQRRFARFQREFNEDRPHEALAMATPAELYMLSPRCYPRRLPGPTYDIDQIVRRATSTGRSMVKGRGVYVGRNLGGELVAFREVATDRWEVRFYDHILGHVDVCSPRKGMLRPT